MRHKRVFIFIGCLPAAVGQECRILTVYRPLRMSPNHVALRRAQPTVEFTVGALCKRAPRTMLRSGERNLRWSLP